MKKRTLLCTTIAGAMIITGMSLPKVKADESAVINAVEQRFATSDYLLQTKKKSIVVELKDGNTLTRNDIVKIVETKYGKKGIVKSIKLANGTEVVEDTGAVGTGAEVTLTTGKKFTVVLYGDVTGDGKITNLDAQTVLDEYFAGNVLKTEEAKKAADITREGIDNIDAQQILDFFFINCYTDGNYGKYVEDVKLPENPAITNEELASLLDVKAEKIEDGTDEQDNTNSIKNVVTEMTSEGAEVTVDAVVSKVKNVKGPNESNENNAPWYKIKLNTGDVPCDIRDINAEEVQYVEKEDSEPELWVKLKEEEAVSLKVGNNNDPDEEITLNINIKDVDKPELSKATDSEETGSEEAQRNEAQIRNEDIDADPKGIYEDSSHEIEVELNTNAMVPYERDGETKKWYKLELTTQMAAKKLTVLENVNGEMVQLPENRIELLEGDNNANKLILWLDGDQAETKIKLVNKECIEEQKESAQEVTVKVTPDTDLSLRHVFVAPAVAAEGDQKDNQEKVLTTMTSQTTKHDINDGGRENYTQAEITIKAPIIELKEYGILDTTYGVNTKAQANDKEKYIGLVIDIEYPVEQVSVTEAQNAKVELLKKSATKLRPFVNKLKSSDSYVSTTNKESEMLVFVDADKVKEEGAEITLKTVPEAGTVVKPDGEKFYDETLTFKITLEDYSKPVVKTESGSISKPESINVGDAYKDNYSNNEKATTIDGITISSSNSGLTATFNPKVRVAGVNKYGDDVENRKAGAWYAIYVKTGVDRNVLQVKYPVDNHIEKGADQLVGDDVEPDEILIWVDGSSISAQQYEIQNIYDNTKKCTLTITNSDTSDLKITGLTKGTATTTNKDRIVSDVLGGNEESFAALENNLKCFATSSAFTNQTSSDPTEKIYKIKININALQNITVNGKEGRWVPILATLTNDSRITSEFVDKLNGKILGDIGSTQALLWINIDDILAESEKAVSRETQQISKVYEISASADGKGIAEKVKLELILDDQSEIKTLDKDTNTKEANGPAWNPTKEGATANPLSDKSTEIQEAFKNNMTYIKGVDVLDGNTIKVRADLNKMKSFIVDTVNPEKQYKYFALFLDVGTDASQLYADARCEKNVTKPDSKWNDKSSTETTNQFLKWIGLSYDDNVQFPTGQQIVFNVPVYKKDTDQQNIIEKVVIKVIIEQES